METISLANLTPEEKLKLKREAIAEQNAEQKKQTEDRKAYKALVNETVPPLFEMLKELSEILATGKQKTFDSLQTLIQMKQDAYGRDGDQYTHSFTTDQGVTLTIGNRVSDGWDDTVTAGLNKMDAFLTSLGKDENSKMLIGVIKKLLAKDGKGNLKSSRVMSLKKTAEETGNEQFMDAVNIIMQAYHPVKSRLFVTARYKDNTGVSLDLPLDITAVDMPSEKKD